MKFFSLFRKSIYLFYTIISIISGKSYLHEDSDNLLLYISSSKNILLHFFVFIKYSLIPFILNLSKGKILTLFSLIKKKNKKIKK